jgi:hypothetical protein
MIDRVVIVVVVPVGTSEWEWVEERRHRGRGQGGSIYRCCAEARSFSVMQSAAWYREVVVSEAFGILGNGAPPQWTFTPAARGS